MVVRNGGGRVTPEVIDNVAFVGVLAGSAVPDGPLFEVAVIHHTECGGRTPRRLRLPPPVRRAHRHRRIHSARGRRPRPAATVTADVDLPRSAAAISSRISVSGHVYNVATGLVGTVIAAAPATGSA
jgi:carbonic anhydrase